MKNKERVSLQEAYNKVLLSEMPYQRGPKAAGIVPAIPTSAKGFDLGAEGNEEAADAREHYFGPEDALNDTNVPIDFKKTVLNVDDKEVFKTLLSGNEGYNKANGNFASNPRRRVGLTNMMLKVCDAVFALIEEHEGTLPDTRDELHTRLIGIVHGITGWAKAHSDHVGRQILRALRESGIITELGSSTGHSNRSVDSAGAPKKNPKHADFF